MHVIRAIDCRVMPWKNGGGVTTEIAISPPDASLDDFGWRISMAQVASDGAFSRFPGIDRTLAVLAGPGITLAFADGKSVVLTSDGPPYAFDGACSVEGRLLAGPITDLNVMTRGNHWQQHVRRLAGPGRLALAASGDRLIFAVSAGHWTIGEAQIGIGDSVVLEHGEQGLLTGDEAAVGFAIDLHAKTPA
ncbi:HutD family protein [Bosea sp. 124]|uniref:HutD/Ves family protein n=1 Tax=Bosea sp. 124 TaxID=2135642 RepID=UPI000D3664AE|nr:HutD family protein [Bosea sp. 124]PTM39160.1 hypothetical protein C8D03_0637 [Bosea sp. 124]